MMRYTCTKCGVEKPEGDFQKCVRPGRRKQVSSRCRRCISVGQKEAYQREKGARRARSRQWYLRSHYGITVKEWDAMLDAQGGGCAICGEKNPQGRGNVFHVDHDHACCPGQKSCGKCVRALLCPQCNMALGLLRDDLERIDRMRSYLTGEAVIAGG